MENEDIRIGFEAIKEMTIQEVLDLEEDLRDGKN